MDLQETISLGMDLAGRFANQFANRNEVHSLYDKAEKIRKTMRVHFHYGESPAELIEKSRPHETPQAKEYRTSSYQQTTFSYSQKIISLERGSIFHPDLYGLKFPRRSPVLIEDFPIKDYILGEIPRIDSGDLEKFMSDFVLQIMMVDPNGFIAVLPDIPDYEIEDPGIIRKPYPSYIPCTHVLDFSSEFVFARSSEKGRSNSAGMIGEVFYLFTRWSTIKLVEDSRNTENGRLSFSAFVVEDHQTGILRARQLGGVAALLDDRVLEGEQQKYYLSHLQATVPGFNLALTQQSDFQASVTAHLFPRLYEAYSDCPKCNGLGYLDHDDPKGSACGTCGGFGRIVSANSPLMTYTVEPNEAGVVNPPAGYITPDIAVIEQARLIKEGYIRDALRSVNMEMLLESQTAQQQTAEAKRIDRESLHNHFRQVARSIFDMYQWILDSINEMRYGPILSEEELELNRVTIIEPKTYISVLPFEALELLKEAKDSGTHHTTLVKLQEETIMNLFGESIQADIAIASLRLDPFPLYSADDILAIQALMPVSTEDIGIHFSITKLVEIAYMDDPGFLNLEQEDQMTIVRDLYRAMQEITPAVPAT